MLTTTKPKKSISPYQIREIKIDGVVYSFQKNLIANVSFEDELFFIVYPELNIEVWGDDRPEAEDAFNFALQSVIKNIYLEKDENLTDRAIQLKNHLNSIIKLVAVR